MKKHAGLIAATALSGLLMLGGCGMAGSGAADAPEPMTMPMSSHSTAPSGPDPHLTDPHMSDSTAAAGQGAMPTMIHIEGGNFRDALPVAAGGSVTVMNMDAVEHSVTADDGTSFNVMVPAGDTATFTAPMKAGSYEFHSEGGGQLHGVLRVR